MENTQIDHSKRNFMGRGLELMSTLPLIGILYSNFKNSRIHYGINTQEATSSKNTQIIDKFKNIGQGFSESLENLSQDYNSQFHTTELEFKTYVGYDGKMKSGLKPVTKWREPDNVPNHNRVSSWKNNKDDLNSKLSYLQSHPLLDKDKLRGIYINEEKMGALSQSFLNTVLYGGELALLLGYEEIMAMFSYSGPNASLKEKVEATNTTEQIKRRNFIKICGATAGTLTALHLKNKYTIKTDNQVGELRENIQDAKQIVINTPANEAYKLYFGNTPTGLIKEVGGILQEVDSSLKSGVENEQVKASLGEFYENGVTYLTDLEGFFKDGIPEDFGQIVKLGHATKTLEKISKEQRKGSTTDFVLESLIVGGAMASIIVPGEIVNKKYTGKIIQNNTSQKG